MKAVGYRKSLPISDPESLQDFSLPDPVPSGHDLLVEVQAVSVNPVDAKVRMRSAPSEGEVKVLGWDATGIVRATGDLVTLFRPGERVWYAGSIARQGSNSELHLVDERITGPMPASLEFAGAAALPLTAITAWEMLFERLGVPAGKRHSGESILIVGAAGGVGSILTQLASRLTSLQVIATASRPETKEWVSNLGAHHVVDHSRPLAEELKRIGLLNVTYVASLTQTDKHFEQIAEAIAPQGKICLIDDPPLIDIRLLKRKSVSLHWELMFTRPVFQTSDMIAQHDLLTEVSKLVDNGVLRTTVADHFGRINAENLKRAHALIESGKARGKIVLEGF